MVDKREIDKQAAAEMAESLKGMVIVLNGNGIILEQADERDKPLTTKQRRAVARTLVAGGTIEEAARRAMAHQDRPVKSFKQAVKERF